jgi:hypothetical protein
VGVAAWILGACLGAAAVAIVVLAVALRRTRRLATSTETLAAAARAAVHDAIAAESAAHVDELRRTLARERADTLSQLATEERRLANEQQSAFDDRARRASAALAETLAVTERRLDERLRGMVDDLDRAQRHVDAQVQRLTERQQQAVAEIEARIEREAAELGSTTDEQRQAVLRLRDELERAAASAVAEALDELEAQTIERRRAIEEITERLRAREAAIAEGIEQAENDARTRLELTLIEFERRQTERLERVTEREIDRHAQIAASAFDERMREIREESAGRLARELDRAADVILREDLARRLDEAS